MSTNLGIQTQRAWQLAQIQIAFNISFLYLSFFVLNHSVLKRRGAGAAGSSGIGEWA